MKTIMNTRIYLKGLILTLMAVFVVSCGEDFLTVVPREHLSAETVFSDASGGDLFLSDIYNNLPDQETLNSSGVGYDSFEMFGDNAVARYDWCVSWNVGISRDYGPNNTGFLYAHGYPSIPFYYPRMMESIRKCNVFIKNVNDHASNFTDDWKTKRLAEARFLRAYFYHMAWMAYGGLPIITVPLDRNTMGDDIFVARSSFQETFEFITGELGEIAPDLPNEIGGGHATRGAALALKGWCELFAGRYDLAAVTNLQVMNLGVYNLYPDFGDLFMEEANNSVESIFAYQHVPGNKTSQRSMLFGPIGEYNGWGFMQPTQNLVEQYRMAASGLPIGEDPSYNAQNPYVGREERFYQSIIYNGSTFSGKTYNMIDLYDPGSSLWTGYYRRKGIMEPLELGQEGYNFMYFRFAEVLLSYAEAKIELDQIDDTVIDAIDRVRDRGGLPSLEDTYNKTSFTQAELRPIVRTERRIELAFEGKRYWDLIRWREAEVVLNQPIRGINYESGNYVEKNVHSMSFDASKNYLFPMDQGWIDTNPKWQEQNTSEFTQGQNPGY